MGERQNKGRLFFRAYWLVGIWLCGFLSFGQKMTKSVHLQNTFYTEISSLEETQQIVINSNTQAKCDTLTGVLQPLYLTTVSNETTSVFWSVKAYLNFDYEDGTLCIAKIAKMQDTLVLGNEVFTFFKTDGCWQERKLDNLANIRYAIQVLKPDSFWAFYNQDKSDFSEIDAIKTRFKDAEGILDIDKLGAYLQAKPAVLSKYCDF